MGLARAVVGGVAGAVALNLLHESVRRAVPSAPRVDKLAMDLVEEGLRKVDREPPSEQGLYRMAMGGDLISNAAYFSLAGIGKSSGAWWRGLLLGLGAGAATVAFPWLAGGYGREEVAGTTPRAAMTVAWYTAGGLVAGGVITMWGWLRGDDENEDEKAPADEPARG